MQYAMAVRAKRDALLFGFADRGLQIVSLGGKFVDGLLAFFDYVMKVDYCRVLKPAMTAFLCSLVIVPQFPNAVLAFQILGDL